ncbi:MAG: copper chaperone PCu(A)C [Burkholderiaceae bacterium]|nr:copper chaperone PCu(A)C [Burkholderiaceae bacterium]
MKSILPLLSLLVSAAALAQTTVQVEDPWVRGTVTGQPATGAFMRLTPSAHARLVAARSPVAGVVEIHEMAMDGDVMKMRQIPGLDLAAGRTMELKPGGYHVMLMSLKQPLKGGQSVPLTLIFEDERGKRFEQTLAAPVTALGAGNAAMPAAPASVARR